MMYEAINGRCPAYITETRTDIAFTKQFATATDLRLELLMQVQTQFCRSDNAT